MDKTYGPKLNYTNRDITLGDKKVYFVKDTLVIDDTHYMLTPGLIRVLFFKHPTIYTENDLEVYKQIFVQTSANLSFNGSKIKKGGNKYTEIIVKLFPTSGSGFSMKL